MMYGLYELNEVIDEFLKQIEQLKNDIILKSGFAVVFVSTLAFMVGK